MEAEHGGAVQVLAVLAVFKNAKKGEPKLPFVLLLWNQLASEILADVVGFLGVVENVDGHAASHEGNAQVEFVGSLAPDRSIGGIGPIRTSDGKNRVFGGGKVDVLGGVHV